MLLPQQLRPSSRFAPSAVFVSPFPSSFSLQRPDPDTRTDDDTALPILVYTHMVVDSPTPCFVASARWDRRWCKTLPSERAEGSTALSGGAEAMATATATRATGRGDGDGDGDDGCDGDDDDKDEGNDDGATNRRARSLARSITQYKTPPCCVGSVSTRLCGSCTAWRWCSCVLVNRPSVCWKMSRKRAASHPRNLT